MKFTKEQAFEILRSNLTNGGKKTLRMSEKSINAQLDTLIPLVANDDMELNDFIEKVKPTFATMNSNAEIDNSENDVVKSWGIALTGYSRVRIKSSASGAYGSSIISFSISIRTVLAHLLLQLIKLQ